MSNKKQNKHKKTFSDQLKEGGFQEEFGLQFGISKNNDQPIKPEELSRIRKEMAENKSKDS